MLVVAISANPTGMKGRQTQCSQRPHGEPVEPRGRASGDLPATASWFDKLTMRSTDPIQSAAPPIVTLGLDQRALYLPAPHPSAVPSGRARG